MLGRRACFHTVNLYDSMTLVNGRALRTVIEQRDIRVQGRVVRTSPVETKSLRTPGKDEGKGRGGT